MLLNTTASLFGEKIKKYLRDEFHQEGILREDEEAGSFQEVVVVRRSSSEEMQNEAVIYIPEMAKLTMKMFLQKRPQQVEVNIFGLRGSRERKMYHVIRKSKVMSFATGTFSKRLGKRIFE